MTAARRYSASVPSVLGTRVGAGLPLMREGCNRSPGTGRESPGTYSDNGFVLALTFGPWLFCLVVGLLYVFGVGV